VAKDDHLVNTPNSNLQVAPEDKINSAQDARLVNHLPLVLNVFFFYLYASSCWSSIISFFIHSLFPKSVASFG
jgi:hypothetical protein